MASHLLQERLIGPSGLGREMMQPLIVTRLFADSGRNTRDASLCLEPQEPIAIVEERLPPIRMTQKLS